MEKYNIGRISLGIFYLVAAVVNLIHTIHNTHYLWSVCLENVLFSFYKDILEQIVIPNEKLIILMVVVFEFIVGVLILSKDVFVKIGLILATLWVLFVAQFLPWVDILGHLLLGIFQGLLLMGNYDTTILEIVTTYLKGWGSNSNGEVKLD
ncbi:MAG: hypothetical protein JSV04_08420 [Candidatus Heimdallarchaeota archaeon]|nr:MAG: hypothetical protein JSV04_08420 [Candidatus Heimdallarchaeota archaeon]